MSVVLESTTDMTPPSTIMQQGNIGIPFKSEDWWENVW